MTISGEVSDLKKAIKFMKEKGMKKIGVLGASLGGCVTLLAYEKNMDCIILWFPVVFLTDIKATKFFIKHKEEIMKKGKILYEDDKKRNKKYFVGKELCKEWFKTKQHENIKNITCSVLFITGDKDEVVPPEQSYKGHEMANKPKALEIIKGANHCWKDKDWNSVEEYENRAISLTVDWFVKWLK
jgi:dienelactone hydrolase